MGGDCGGTSEEMRGLRSAYRYLQNSLGDVKYSIGNEEVKELSMNPGHEQWCGDCLRECGVLGGREQREKNRDNCNGIINTI